MIIRNPKTPWRESKMTKDEFDRHIRTQLNKDYNASVVVAALYKKIYGHFPKIGLSGAQADFANQTIENLPFLEPPAKEGQP